MKTIRFKTHYAEWAVVAVILAGVNLLTRAKAIEWIGAGAVLLSFGHASISDRMAEKQARMSAPDVECYRWSVRYFAGKEVLWVVYFIMHHSYSALVGCGVFLVYPFWRVVYRRWKPLDR
jgi:hypothetical protein